MVKCQSHKLEIASSSLAPGTIFQKYETEVDFREIPNYARSMDNFSPRTFKLGKATSSDTDAAPPPATAAPVATAPAAARPAVTSPAAPEPSPNDMGGTKDPALNEYLNQVGNTMGGAKHPRFGTFLTGSFKGKTPGQMREQLVTEYQSGRRRDVGGGNNGAAGGVQGATMTGGPSSFTPTAQWNSMTKPRGIATPAPAIQSPAETATNAAVPMATAASAMGGAGGLMASAGMAAQSAVTKGLARPGAPSTAQTQAAAKPAPTARPIVAIASPAAPDYANDVKAGFTPYGRVGKAAQVVNQAQAAAPAARQFLAADKANTAAQAALPGADDPVDIGASFNADVAGSSLNAARAGFQKAGTSRPSLLSPSEPKPMQVVARVKKSIAS